MSWSLSGAPVAAVTDAPEGDACHRMRAFCGWSARMGNNVGAKMLTASWNAPTSKAFFAAIDFADWQSRQPCTHQLHDNAVAATRCNRCPRGTEDMTTPRTFTELGVPESLTNVLAAQGITAPFPIQVDTLPDTLAGRDVLGRGKTGSGKTLAFSIPLVTRLSSGKRRPSRPSGLVLAPTRELATQISATLAPLAAARGLKVSTIFGGVPQGRQVSALKSGIDIVVACPGRLEDLMKQRVISLDSVLDHRARRGRPHGRPRLSARRHPHPGRDPGRRSAADVLRHAR